MKKANATVRLEETKAGGFCCKTEKYEVILDGGGNITSLKAGGVEFLGGVPGFISGGKIGLLKKVIRAGNESLIAESGPQDPSKSEKGAPSPVDARIVYTFNPDSIELALEQSMQCDGFSWIPSASVISSRDALTDYGFTPGETPRYQQTNPRWLTKEGAVLRFDFGVWQKGFANASWANLNVEGKNVAHCNGNISKKHTIYPEARPGIGYALTFDISADSPDFIIPSGNPCHFDIKVKNAGSQAVKGTVQFEIRDYLTQKPIASKKTEVNLQSKGEMTLPTDLKISEPGPYRAAIVIEEDKKVSREFGWVFTYDFEHYEPKITRQPDFKKFWKDTLAELKMVPLDAKLQRVAEKSNAKVDAYKVSFATLGGRRIYGWYARPKTPGKYPAHIRFPSSGIYPITGPENYEDRACLWILIHGFDVDLSNMPQGDDPGKNYWTAGIESPQTSMWRIIYASLVRAVDFMIAQPEVDPARIAVWGGSQGGGLCMVAAALDSRVGICMPFHSGLARLDWTVKYGPGYWPFGMNAKPPNQSEEEFLKTLSYFDTANFTQDIACPVLVEVGLMDTVTAPGNQICALAHVPRKNLYLVCSPWTMHGCASRPGNLSGECYARFLKGELPLPPRK